MGSTNGEAYGYLRVSGNGQQTGHGFERQRESISRWAEKAGYDIADTFKDAHTGTANALDRPGFAKLMQSVNGHRTIVVERLDRLARSVNVQEQAILWLAAHDIDLVVADTGENVTAAYKADPMKKALVQIQAVFAELEKSMLVKKLRAAREEKRMRDGKCEGRKAYGEYDPQHPERWPQERECVKRIRELRRKRPKQRRLGYHKIAHKLQEEGWPTRSGKEWSPWSVRSIIEGWVYEELGKRS